MSNIFIEVALTAILDEKSHSSKNVLVAESTVVALYGFPDTITFTSWSHTNNPNLHLSLDVNSHTVY